MMGALLLMVRGEHLQAGVRALRGIERLAGGAVLLVVGANIVQTFAIKGSELYIVDDARMLTVVARPQVRADTGPQGAVRR